MHSQWNQLKKTNEKIYEKHDDERFEVNGPVGGDTYDDEDEQSVNAGADSAYTLDSDRYRLESSFSETLEKMQIILALTYFEFLLALIAFVYFKFIDLKIKQDYHDLRNEFVQKVTSNLKNQCF